MPGAVLPVVFSFCSVIKLTPIRGTRDFCSHCLRHGHGHVFADRHFGASMQHILLLADSQLVHLPVLGINANPGGSVCTRTENGGTKHAVTPEAGELARTKQNHLRHDPCFGDNVIPMNIPLSPA